MLCRVDSDDALIGNQGIDEADWFAVVVFVDNHRVPP
jgi:subtilase family serine protease